MFESTTTFIKVTQMKRDESDSQSLTKVLYHQKPLQIIPGKEKFEFGYDLLRHSAYSA